MLPQGAFANFLDNFNKKLHDFGQDINHNINQVIKKSAISIPIPFVDKRLAPKVLPPIAPIRAAPALPPIIKKKIAIIGDWQAYYLGNYLKNLYEKNNYIEIHNLANGCQDTAAKSCYGANLTIAEQPQLQSQLRALNALNPDLAIIFIGANDYTQTDDSFKENAENFMNTIKLTAKHIIWLGVPVYKIRATDKFLENYSNLQQNNTILQQHNEVYEAICEANNLLYIDLWQDFNEAYSSSAQLLTPDTVGFTETSLKIIANKLQTTFQELSQDSKENYKPNQAFIIIPQQPSQNNHIYKLSELLDHSPILLGSLLENRNEAILKPQFNPFPPKGRADNFVNY